MKKQLLKYLRPFVERFPKMAMTYRYLRDSWQLMDEPVDTKHGFKFVGNRSMQEGQYEREETEIVRRILGHIDVCINVGANIGYYSCIARNAGKTVIAFEPIELNLRYLLKNIRANKWDSGIEIFPLALSNKVGVIEIYGGAAGASLVEGWAGTQKHYVKLVPTSTLDVVLGSRFRGQKIFIVVDIEGAEKDMLDGALSFLSATPKPIWMVEILISEHQPSGISINPNLLATFQTFWAHGYEAWTANQERRLVSPAEVEAIINSGKDTLGTHNYLFLERGKAELLNAPAAVGAR